ncbi:MULTISPECIES: glycosyl hydrolase 108 family protein [unclassified Acidovorax]|jgi:lysozyme family protein|uniref:glycosyl hydrolase 108 family protein n=1 Tax=unclassified Acidovorax TaxID=2684926 RepID=UPI000A4BFDC6|nr:MULTISPECIES: glycosyl hydrolase 108 family protein [unclassified Acidovorax]
MSAQGQANLWPSLGAAILAILGGVLAVEKGYVNNPADPGGETNHGITVAIARNEGYTGPMRELPKERAEAIYIRDYVSRPGFDRVIAISPAVGEKLVDAGVNTGQAQASRWLQRALNNLSRGGQDYALV